MKIDVVYTTYRNDLAWICYSIQFLQKHLKGKYGIVVRANADCNDVIGTWGFKNVRYHYVIPWPDSYNYHMYLKTTSDEYSEADVLMLLDSDHFLLKPANLEDFFDDGKPVIRYRNWDDDPDNPGYKIWAPPTERTMGMPLDKDYMVAPPFIFRRDTFGKVRDRVKEVTGVPFKDAIYSDTPYSRENFLAHPMKFCDYEALGLYAATFQPESYVLRHWESDEPSLFRVYWSHGDWSPTLRAQLDSLLAA